LTSLFTIVGILLLCFSLGTRGEDEESIGTGTLVAVRRTMHMEVTDCARQFQPGPTKEDPLADGSCLVTFGELEPGETLANVVEKEGEWTERATSSGFGDYFRIKFMPNGYLIARGGRMFPFSPWSDVSAGFTWLFQNRLKRTYRLIIYKPLFD
jgi:hypothetical protein